MLSQRNIFPWNNQLLILIIVSVLLISSACRVYGFTYYVDNSGTPVCGNIPSYGTEIAPWCTISYGVSRMNGGDTLYVKAGTYLETLYISDKHGSAERNIIIQAFSGHKVIIRGNGINTGRVKLINSSHITFAGFEVTNFNQGIWIVQSNNITVQNCNIYHIGQEAITILYNSKNVIIEKCIIHDTKKYGYNGEGIYIGTASREKKDNTNNVTVRNNIIYNTLDEAVELKPGTHDCLVEGNHIYNVRTGSYYGAVEVNEATLGIQDWPSNPNHIIRNNIIHDTDTAVRAGTGCVVYNNVIYNVRPKNYGILADNKANDIYTRKIYHNTIDEPSSNSIYVNKAVVDIRNNIGPSTIGNLTTKNAYFVNTVREHEDYHIAKDSAPVDAGVHIRDMVPADIEGKSRYRDMAPDIGAYEY